MKDVFASVAAGKAPFSYHAWRVICLGAWIKTFGVQM
jgi:asparagine synthase (glutamine-hydrolysing)